MRKSYALAAMLIFACFASVSALADGVFLGSYNASIVFQDQASFFGDTTMTIAFDGSHYWSSSGGFNPTGYAEYNPNGSLVSTFSVPLDFRSVFSDGAGNVYARQFANSTIYKQTSPGVFSSFLTLNGGSLDAQSDVVLNSAGTRYISMQGGTVQQWDLAGNFIGTVTLNGYADNGYPSDRAIASAGGYFLTYFGGQLQAWDAAGNLAGSTILNGAGTSFDSYFSLSYANGMVFVVDVANGNWRGYDVGLGGGGGVPEPGTLVMLGTGVLGIAGAIRRKLI